MCCLACEQSSGQLGHLRLDALLEARGSARLPCLAESSRDELVQRLAGPMQCSRRPLRLQGASLSIEYSEGMPCAIAG